MDPTCRVCLQRGRVGECNIAARPARDMRQFVPGSQSAGDSAYAAHVSVVSVAIDRRALLGSVVVSRCDATDGRITATSAYSTAPSCSCGVEVMPAVWTSDCAASARGTLVSKCKKCNTRWDPLRGLTAAGTRHSDPHNSYCAYRRGHVRHAGMEAYGGSARTREHNDLHLRRSSNSARIHVHCKCDWWVVSRTRD